MKAPIDWKTEPKPPLGPAPIFCPHCSAITEPMLTRAFYLCANGHAISEVELYLSARRQLQ